MTSHNKPVSTIIEKANRTSCHRKNFICKHVEILILLRRLLQSENLNSPTAQTVGLRFTLCSQNCEFLPIVCVYKIFPVTRESIAFAIEIEKEKLC